MNRNFLVVAVSIFILNSAQVMAQNYKITSRTTDTGKEETYTDKSTGEVRKEITYNENGIKTKTLEITNGEQGRIYTKYDGNENLVSVTYYDKVGTVIQLDTWAKDGSKTSRTYVNPHDLKTYRMIKKIYSTDGVTLTSEDVYVPSASAISQYEHMSAGLNISEGDLVKADKATLELIEKTKALGPIIDNKTVISSAETNYPSVVLPWSMLPPINKPAPKSNVVEVPFGAHHYYTPQGDDSKEYDEIINKKVVTYSDKGTGAIVHIIVYSDDARTIKKEESIYNDKGKEVLSRVYGVDGSSIKNEYITEYSADGTTLIKTTYKEYRQDGSLFKQKTMNEQDKSEVNETYRKDGQTLSYRSVREQTDMGISVIDREETWYAKDGKTPAKTQSEKTEASNSYFKVIKYLYPNGQAKEVEVFTKPTGVLFTVNTTTYNEAGEVTSEKTETGDLNIVNKNFDMHTPNTELPLYEYYKRNGVFQGSETRIIDERLLEALIKDGHISEANTLIEMLKNNEIELNPAQQKKLEASIEKINSTGNTAKKDTNNKNTINPFDTDKSPFEKLVELMRFSKVVTGTEDTGKLVLQIEELLGEIDPADLGSVQIEACMDAQIYAAKEKMILWPDTYKMNEKVARDALANALGLDKDKSYDRTQELVDKFIDTLPNNMTTLNGVQANALLQSYYFYIDQAENTTSTGNYKAEYKNTCILNAVLIADGMIFPNMGIFSAMSLDKDVLSSFTGRLMDLTMKVGETTTTEKIIIDEAKVLRKNYSLVKK